MNITWDLSNKCNLCCKHCAAFYDMRENATLNKTEMLQIAENLAKIADSIVLVGGEPLLCPWIDDITKILYENDVQIDIISNGQLICGNIENIIRNRIARIMVSVDGLQEFNDEVRGKGSWNKAISFIKKIVDIQSDSPNLTIGIETVLTKKSIHGMEKFVETMYKIGVQYFVFSPLLAVGKASENIDELMLDDNRLLDTYISLAQISVKQNIQMEFNTEIGRAHV